jgi:small subunit ribosomal protein S2
MAEDLLISKQEYLSAGIHIGMTSRTKDMKKFIYKIREDGLAVLDLKRLDERISKAAKLLADAKKILVVGRKLNSHKPIKKFAKIVGADYVKGRFMPGTLTNPTYEKFIEPDVILLTDPLSDYQALKEAVDSRIPIVALCDTFNETRNIDLVIPCNNKGRKSLALIYWLLAREIMKNRGEKEFKYKIEDFSGEKKLKEKGKPAKK